MPADPRVHPLIHLDPPAIEAMMAPVLGGTTVRVVTPVDGGLTNTTYRVTAADGAVYGLRVHAGGPTALERERQILAALRGTIPVPDVLFIDAGGAHPYLVYRWIEGITLNQCRREAGPAALLALAQPLGGMLARTSAAPLPGLDGALDEIRIDALLAEADERLRTGLARARLGAELADALRATLAANAARLNALEHAGGLVHGDFGGRNVLVRRDGDGGWEISGVIDWESAGTGSAMWDVGSLFRYPLRYTPLFRDEFERGYRAAGGELPEDWWRAARLLDSTRLVAILAEPRDLPSVFAECRELTASIVASDGQGC